ncbi:DPP IV N-terminal domain-containing protein [Dokdonella sp.]|uniref:S9 family peptidase n=1 Tax=Dokdonella sp. TaxID=2291710 RepID=UPI0031C83713|nr:S9 family peptidase [Dokdonella sp.]
MRVLLLPILMLSLSHTALAERLTIERIFADPGLDGPTPRGLEVAPDGQRVTFLRGREDDQNQLDLWQYEIATGRSARLVDSTALGEARPVSELEQARRERARTAQLKGIVSYRWAPDGTKLLFGLDERLWLYDFSAREDARLRALTAPGTQVIDAKVSPRGRYVSWVADQNLIVLDLRTGRRRALTRDGRGPLHNAEAEFVAQEEMDRSTGYWWAPDDSMLAFEQFDEAGVDEVERSEVHAARTVVVRQRYPSAGRPNVKVRLGLVKPTGGRVRWIDLGAEPDIYLARVDWLPDGRRVAFQRQSRDQRRLDLVAVDVHTLQHAPLLTETSDTWINLHHDLRFLHDEDAFVWASERSGYRQLQVVGLDGQPRRRLTHGDYDVDALLALDEKAGLAYFAANRDDVLEAQVYAVRLDGSNAAAPLRISEGAGWHAAVFADDASVWIDTFSNPGTPPQVSLRRNDGRRIAWIEANELRPGHPYWPYRDALIAPEFGTLASEDGQALHYRLLKPAGFEPTRRYPVFMTWYGGPGRQYVTRAWGNHFEQYMAQQGYVVFALDNRGTPRRGRRFSDAIFGQLGKAEVADQLAGVAWLKARPWVDGARIGAFGWSYGGYQTLMLLARSDAFAAGAAVAPVTDWALYDTHYTERFLGMPGANPDGYAASGVLKWVAAIPSDKLLLIHGMADDNVLFAHSTELMVRLQEQGTQFRLMAYPGARHGLSTPALKTHVHTLVAEFFAGRFAPAAPASALGQP